jgi:hypothetical protein
MRRERRPGEDRAENVTARTSRRLPAQRRSRRDLREREFYATTRNYILKFDVTTWGWIHLLLGLVVLFAGFAVLSGKHGAERSASLSSDQRW